MKVTKTIMVAGILCLFSTLGLAATATAVKDLPDGSQVTLTGTVEDFDSEHAFMLRDGSGAIKVDLSSTNPIVLKDGDKVDVTGLVNHTILGTDIVARSVNEDKGVGERVGEAIDSVTGQDVASSAKTVSVKSMPDSGLIRISGIVDNVDSEKKFTLKDSTGYVDVTIKSGESASLEKGTEVTVIGNVDKGLLGKSIDAIEVDVRSSSSSVVAQ